MLDKFGSILMNRQKLLVFSQLSKYIFRALNENMLVAQLGRKSPTFHGTESLLLCSQELITGSCGSEPDEASLHLPMLLP